VYNILRKNRLGVTASRVRISFSPLLKTSLPGGARWGKYIAIGNRGGLLICVTIVEECDATKMLRELKLVIKDCFGFASQGELAERYRTGLLSQGWGNTRKFSR
jgi:hypothetical protein